MKPIFWLLYGNSKNASSRLQGYLIHEHLKYLGYNSNLFLPPEFRIRDFPLKGADIEKCCHILKDGIVIFQKLMGPNTIELIQKLRRQGATTIYIEPDFREANMTINHCDHVVLPSKTLQAFYIEKGLSTFYIPDPIECLRSPTEIKRKESRPIKLAWTGIRANLSRTQVIRKILSTKEFKDFQLVTVSNHPSADFQWKLETVFDVLKACDIGVIPTGEDFKSQVKSNNRLTLFMALGLPVVAGFLPAYTEIIENDKNGYLCSNESDWANAFRELRSPEKRHQIGLNGYLSVKDKFSLDAVVQKWISLFKRIEAESKPETLDLPADFSSKNSQLEHKLHRRFWLKLGIKSFKKGRWKNAGIAFRKLF